MLATVVLAFAVAAVQGQTMPGLLDEPAVCCFDKQFSAVVGEIGAFGLGADRERLLDGVAKLGYDFYNRHAATETYMRQPNGTVVPIFELRDFHTKMHYRKVGNNTCRKEPLTSGSMLPPCIPGNATKLFESSLGYSGVGETLHGHHSHNHTHGFHFNMTMWQQFHSGNHSFTWNHTRHHHSRLGVQFFEFDVPDVNGQSGRMKLGVTMRNCIPVIDIFTGTRHGQFYEMNRFFNDYHPGIEDMSVFDLPSDCQ